MNTNIISIADHLEDPSTGPAVFNFERDWHLVTPHLNHPKVRATLKNCMEIYCAERAVDCEKCGLDPSYWKRGYDPKLTPWHYDSTDFWTQRASELADEAIQRGEVKWEVAGEEPTDEEMDRLCDIEEKFYPADGGFESYQIRCYLRCGCYWLAPWLKELGERMFPQLHWEFLRDEYYGLACGRDEDGTIKMIFDIMHFDQPANELIGLGCDHCEDNSVD